jgi:putative transposase
MSNTYSQIYIQTVFAVKWRESLIPAQHREELHKFIAGIVRNRGQKLFAVFCMPDHAHIFMSLSPSISVSDLMQDIKAGSSKFINDSGWINKPFRWQEGFGAFSYSKSHVDRVVKYILNQESHHQKITFRKEYIAFFKKFEIEFDEKYLFEFFEWSYTGAFDSELY